MTEFIEKYQKVPVTEYKNKVKNEPLVSVCVQTYQHVNYIKDCLDSILMQKTTFPFEILLGEDASTDGTREICIEYAEKYPKKIRLFLHHRENNIKINGSPTGRFNFLYNLYSAHAKYIAFCEGDDYWTDPYKLQKQVDFLENNSQYSFVVHNFDIMGNNNIDEGVYKKSINLLLKENNGFDITKKVYFNSWTTQPVTLLFRKGVLKKFENKIKEFKYFRDIYLIFLLLNENNGYFMNFNGAVYRFTGKGVFSSNSKKKKLITNIQNSKELFIYSRDIGFLKWIFKNLIVLGFEYIRIN